MLSHAHDAFIHELDAYRAQSMSEAFELYIFLMYLLVGEV